GGARRPRPDRRLVRLRRARVSLRRRPDAASPVGRPQGARRRAHLPGGAERHQPRRAARPARPWSLSTGGDEQLSVSCCIAGGGPAGMMLGLLLARAGVDVVVLEKHGDFLRDFRGDTIHPSTLEVMHELGLLDRFLQLPHQKIERLGVAIGDEFLPFADFTHLPTPCRFVALMPQWHFLDFLASEAAHTPTFALRMRAEVTDLIYESGDIVGVRARAPDGGLTIRARLVIGADGRTSLVRERAKLPVDELGAPMDVLWFRLSRRADDGVETMGRIAPGRFVVMIDRGDYWQCGFLI